MSFMKEQNSRAVVVFLFLGFLCANYVQAQESQKKVVAVVGDSLSTGKYPQFLESSQGKDFKIVSYARKNARMTDICDQFILALRENKLDYVVIYGGVNNCRAWQKYRGETTQFKYVVDFLNVLIGKATKAGVIPVVVKHHGWDASLYDRTPVGWSCSREINVWLDGEEFMCEPAIVVDTSELSYQDWDCPFEWQGYGGCHRSNQLKDKYDGGDGLHLNYAGQKKLAQLVAEAILKNR